MGSRVRRGLAWALELAGRCFPWVEAQYRRSLEDHVSGRWLLEARYDKGGDTWPG